MRRRESTRRQLGIGGEKDYATIDESQNEAPEHMSKPRRFPGRTAKTTFVGREGQSEDVGHGEDEAEVEK